MIGINYISNEHESDDLGGCVNDVLNLEEVLINKCHFNLMNITKLINKDASKENILNELNKLVEFSHENENSEIWLNYSGHGGGQFSITEEDNQSEFICPSDYAENGLIHDSWLKENFVNKLSKSTKCFVLMDCCNSGSNINLPFVYNDVSTWNLSKKDEKLCKIIKISGSKDNQYSADYFDSQSKSYQGALTNSFLKTFTMDYVMEDQYKMTTYILRERGFTQIPDLTFSDSTLLNFKLC